MKKLLTIIPAAVLAVGTFTAMSISASASCHNRYSANSCHTPAAVWNYGRNTSAVNTQSGTSTATVQPRALHYFIDSNNDGICDNCSNGTCLSNGLCSSYFYGHGNFIDNNNDGICDNCADGVCTQHGYFHGYGNFIDENNDGICDNCADGVCTQHGIGLGYHHGGCHR